MKLIYLILILVIFSVGLIFCQSSFAVAWNTLSNDKISIEYPSNWVITQRDSTTTHPSDLNITNPSNDLNQFRVIYENDFWVNHNVQSLGLEDTLDQLNQRLNVQGGVESIIVGGSPAASIIATLSGYWPEHNNDYPIHIASEMFLIDKNDRSSLLVYQDDFDDFSTPESQKIMNKMINSVKFLQ